MKEHSSPGRIRRFVRALQRADTPVKQRWFFGSAAISFVVVFTIWVVYVSTAIVPLSENITSEKSGSFGSTFKAGIENLTRDLGEKYDTFKKNLDKNIKTIEEKITETNTITIEGTDTQPFVPAPLENVPTTPLP